MIYTSYFGNVRKIQESMPGARLVCVAGGVPDWFKGERFRSLAPKYLWWKEWKEKFGGDPESKESIEWYAAKYRETVLDALDPKEIARQLDGSVLLCYEKPPKFCHRNLIREWLNGAGIECAEFSGETYG